jgi:mono/diheme cytochrome c family protein
MTHNYSPGKILGSIFTVFLLVNLSSCNRDRNHPGWDYFPDMFYSTAYETYSKNPNFENGMTMRVPVPGTIPRDFIPFEYTNDPESRIKAGKELVNPIIESQETLARGTMVYTTFCIGCHGIAGKGDGHLFTSGLYPLKPLSLTGDTAVNLKDGEIFHTITLGIRSMGEHGSLIRPDDRWMLVQYIRKLQEERIKLSDIKRVVSK